MNKLNYFYCLQHPTSNSVYSGCVALECEADSIAPEDYTELKKRLQVSAQKASNGLIKADKWSVTALNVI